MAAAHYLCRAMRCITLLSDLGTDNNSAAVAKGILHTHLPGIPVLDITHEVTVNNRAEAAYLLKAASRHFGTGTIHLAICDIYYNTSPGMVIAEQQGQYFIAPANGILELAFTEAEIWICPHQGRQVSFVSWIRSAARMAQRLLLRPLAELKLQPAAPFLPPGNSATGSRELRCSVLHVDQRGNIVLDVTREQLQTNGRGRNFTVKFVRVEEIGDVSLHYNDVGAGYELCRYNTAGHLEISINRGRADDLFGIRPGSEHNDIKIVFE